MRKSISLLIISFLSFFIPLVLAIEPFEDWAAFDFEALYQEEKPSSPVQFTSAAQTDHALTCNTSLATTPKPAAPRKRRDRLTDDLQKSVIKQSITKWQYKKVPQKRTFRNGVTLAQNALKLPRVVLPKPLEKPEMQEVTHESIKPVITAPQRDVAQTRIGNWCPFCWFEASDERDLVNHISSTFKCQRKMGNELCAECMLQGKKVIDSNCCIPKRLAAMVDAAVLSYKPSCT